MIPKLDAETLEPVSWPRGARRSSGARPATATSTARCAARACSRALLERGLPLRDDLQLRQPRRDRRRRGSPRSSPASEIPFLMEVVEGTEADRKGGHIARRRADGALVLRETAQTPPGEEESFRDFRRWRYYNTNNLWIDLRALDGDARRDRRRARAAADRQPQDGRPARSRARRRCSSSRARWAPRSAASRARSVLRVPRTRFVPVKTHRRPAGAALGRLRADRRHGGRAGRRATRCPSSSSTRATTGCSTSSSGASRRARRRCARPSGWSCAATSPSAPASSCAGRSSSTRPSR